MTSLWRWCCLLLVLLSGSAIAFGDSLTVGAPITGITLTVSDNALKNMGYSQGVNAYIDPYQGTLDGNAVVLFCVDPDHFDGSGAYNVNVSVGATGTSTEQYINGGAAQATKVYDAEAYLAQLLLNTPVSNVTGRQDIQAAIWNLADSSATFPGFADFQQQCDAAYDNNVVCKLEGQALSATNIPSFEILTDASCTTGNCGSSARQEYLVLTPEPSSVLLSMSGLLGFFTFRRRRTS